MVAMAEVVRITDRFCDRKNPDSIDRQGKLGQVVALVMIFYAIMFIAFIKFQELEKKHPRIIHDVDVSFEFTAPPPEPTFKVGEMPKPISLTEGENANPGSEAAAKPAASDTVALPTIKAEETTKTPNLQAKPVAANKVTEAAPVMVTSTNVIKTQAPDAKSMPKQAPTTPTNTTMAGIENRQQTSGSAQAGGTPDGAAGGTGTGGEGNGGTGTGAGDPGAGSGFGMAGGQIATKLENTGRAMGNIAPYRKDMLIRIAQNWHPKRKTESIIIIVTIDHDGKLLADEIFQSSGNKKSDKEALAAVESTEFAPLPDWYKGDQLQFKISMDKVEQAQGN
jgi:TonB family protein